MISKKCEGRNQDTGTVGLQCNPIRGVGVGHVTMLTSPTPPDISIYRPTRQAVTAYPS